MDTDAGPPLVPQAAVAAAAAAAALTASSLGASPEAIAGAVAAAVHNVWRWASPLSAVHCSPVVECEADSIDAWFARQHTVEASDREGTGDEEQGVGKGGQVVCGDGEGNDSDRGSLCCPDSRGGPFGGDVDGSAPSALAAATSNDTEPCAPLLSEDAQDSSERVSQSQPASWQPVLWADVEPDTCEHVVDNLFVTSRDSLDAVSVLAAVVVVDAENATQEEEQEEPTEVEKVGKRLTGGARRRHLLLTARNLWRPGWQTADAADAAGAADAAASGVVSPIASVDAETLRGRWPTPNEAEKVTKQYAIDKFFALHEPG